MAETRLAKNDSLYLANIILNLHCILLISICKLIFYNRKTLIKTLLNDLNIKNFMQVLDELLCYTL